MSWKHTIHSNVAVGWAGGNKHLSIIKEYLLQSCTVGDYLTFHHLLSLFPSVQGDFVHSYQSILPSLPNWASACLPPPVRPAAPVFRAVHSPLPPSKRFGTISQVRDFQPSPWGLYLQLSCNPHSWHGRFLYLHKIASQWYWVPVFCDSQTPFHRLLAGLAPQQNGSWV